MVLRIRQLPAVIANQIAAGEVIERPASVVKELLENALDAEANAITVEIHYGGLNQIKISDNGVGICAEDLPLAIAAHATSKICTLDDLYSIHSMGFRGEALASIASIAKVMISSRTCDQAHAMRIDAHEAQFSLTPCARNVGTTIEVDDLFFNAPVRKRFLKSEKIEFQAIEIVVKRFALSAPHVALTVKHNNKLVLNLPAAVNESGKQARLAKIFGQMFLKDALFLDVEHDAMRLYGWISGISFQRSQNDRQWVYINQRCVRDKLINHALKQAYDGLLHPGRFPACLLYFTMRASEVDVNVHPTKHEVRFQNPRLIYDFFTTQLRQALGKERNKLLASSCISEPLSLFQGEEEDHRENNDKRLFKKEFQFPSVMQKNRQEGISNTWLPINQQYAMVFVDGQPHLVDIIGLYHYTLLRELGKAALPLASRPLLVSVGYRLSAKLAGKKEQLQHILPQVGLQIDWLNHHEFKLNTLPIQLPYFAMSLFLAALEERDQVSNEALISLVVQSQMVEIQRFNEDERQTLIQELNQLSPQEMKSFKLGKPFTVEDCRSFFHV